MTTYNACKVFSATKARDREVLGETVTEWLRDPAQAGVQICDTVIRQSSDREFHCLSITLFYCAAERADTPVPVVKRRRNGGAM